jgi:hypothetical protein
MQGVAITRFTFYTMFSRWVFRSCNARFPFCSIFPIAFYRKVCYCFVLCACVYARLTKLNFILLEINKIQWNCSFFASCMQASARAVMFSLCVVSVFVIWLFAFNLYLMLFGMTFLSESVTDGHLILKKSTQQNNKHGYKLISFFVCFCIVLFLFSFIWWLFTSVDFSMQ